MMKTDETRCTERTSWRVFFKTLGEGIKLIRASQILLIIVAISLVEGLFSEGYDRLWTAHLLEQFQLPSLGGLDSVIWFGIIGAVSTILSLLAMEVINRMKLDPQRQMIPVLMLIYGLMMAGILGVALARDLWVMLLMIWLVNITRTVAGPLNMAWINRHTASEVRATVLSVYSQANALGQLTTGPMVGYIGLVSSLRVALSIAGALILPIPFLLAYARRLPHTPQASSS